MAVPENEAVSWRNAFSFAWRETSVLPVLTVLRSVVGDLRRHVGVGAADLGQQPEVLDQRGHLRVEALEVGVQRLDVLADRLAAALERGREWR